MLVSFRVFVGYFPGAICPGVEWENLWLGSQISTAIGLDIQTSTFGIPLIFPFNQQKVKLFAGDLQHPRNGRLFWGGIEASVLPGIRDVSSNGDSSRDEPRPPGRRAVGALRRHPAPGAAQLGGLAALEATRRWSGGRWGRGVGGWKPPAPHARCRGQGSEQLLEQPFFFAPF